MRARRDVGGPREARAPDVESTTLELSGHDRETEAVRGVALADRDEAVRRGAPDLHRLLGHSSEQTKNATNVPKLKWGELRRERLIAIGDEAYRCRRVDLR